MHVNLGFFCLNLTSLCVKRGFWLFDHFPVRFRPDSDHIFDYIFRPCHRPVKHNPELTHFYILTFWPQNFAGLVRNKSQKLLTVVHKKNQLLKSDKETCDYIWPYWYHKKLCINSYDQKSENIQNPYNSLLKVTTLIIFWQDNTTKINQN